MSSELDNKRALVIDDDPGWRITSTKILSKMGLQVDSANDYDHAINLIERANYDLILADVRLRDEDSSDISGLRLLAFVKSRDINTKVVLITGYPNAIIRAQVAREFSFDGLLYKSLNGIPLSLKDLRNKIKKVLTAA